MKQVLIGQKITDISGVENDKLTITLEGGYVITVEVGSAFDEHFLSADVSKIEYKKLGGL